jgi:asparagine synthase (glutamine-hydrolysing)
MGNRLPQEILERRKRGFLVPLDKWLERGLKDYSRDILMDSQAFSVEILGEKKLQVLFEPHKGIKGMEYRVLLWRLLIFEIWHKFYIKNNFKSRNIASHIYGYNE